MTDESRIHDVVVRLLAVELAVSQERVLTARSLREDLGMDSIAAANLLFSLEEELGVEFDEIPRIDTLAELESAVRESLAVGGAPR
jgi:acyl carrier protein